MGTVGGSGVLFCYGTQYPIRQVNKKKGALRRPFSYQKLAFFLVFS